MRLSEKEFNAYVHRRAEMNTQILLGRFGIYLLCLAMVMAGVPVAAHGSRGEPVMKTLPVRAGVYQKTPSAVKSDYRVRLNNSQNENLPPIMAKDFGTTPAQLLFHRLIHMNVVKNQKKPFLEAVMTEFNKNTEGMPTALVRADLLNSFSIAYPSLRHDFKRILSKFDGQKKIGKKQFKLLTAKLREVAVTDTGALWDGCEVGSNLVIGMTAFGLLILYSSILVESSSVLYVGLGVSTLAAWLGSIRALCTP